MENPLNPTRTTPPRRKKDLFTRPRLLAMLQGMLDKKLVLVSAPAGYGKTYLLVDLASSVEMPVCWLSVSALDTEPQRFLSNLVGAIQRRFPRFGALTLAQIENPAPASTDWAALASIMADDLYQATGEHFLLVMDDIHLVGSSLPIMAFLGSLMEQVDENAHFVLASRTTLALPALPMMVARSEVAGLSFEELAFLPDEIQGLFRHNQGVELDRETAEKIIETTEGWITGILLSDRLGPATSGGLATVNRVTGVGLETYYLQFIDQLDQDLRLFMLRSSLLEEFDAQRCEQVIGKVLVLTDQPWQDWIDTILRENYFALPVGEEGAWLRYHNLFMGFLQSRAYREIPVEAQAIERALAEDFRSRQDWESAYAIIRRLGTLNELVDLIETAGYELTLAGKIATLSGWLDALPTELLSSRPGLISLQGNVAAMSGDLTLALTLYDQAVAAMQMPEDYKSMALTLSRRASIQRMAGNLQASMQDAHECLGLVENDLKMRHLKAEVQRCIGVCSNRQGHLKDALKWLTRALKTSQSIRDEKTAAMIRLEIGLVQEALGNYELSLEHYQAALAYWEKGGNAVWLSNVLNNLGVLRHLLGDYSGALDALEKALVQARNASHARLEAYALTGIGDIYLELEAVEEARNTYQRAKSIAQQIPENFLLVYLDVQEASILRAAGDPEKALMLVEQARTLAREGNSPLELNLCNLQTGETLLQQGLTQEATEPLLEACRFFENEGHRVQARKAHLLLALGYGGLHDKERMLDHILPVVASLKAGEPARSLLALASHYQPQLESLASEDHLDQTFAPLIEQITQFRGQVPGLRRSLRQRAGSVPFAQPSLHIRAFGRTQVHLNRRMVSSSDWQTQTSRDLFFLLLAHPEGLTREEIALIFWPDGSTEEVRFRFKNTIYRLRHAVGKEAILLDQDVYRFNNKLDYVYDVEAFLKENACAQKALDRLQRLSHYREALKLYRGNYLPEVNETWAIPLRESFRQIHLNILLQTAETYFALANHELALEFSNRAVEEDPTLEAAHRLLLRVYAAMGNRAAIVRQYNHFCEVLQREINANPSQQTQSLYQELMQS